MKEFSQLFEGVSDPRRSNATRHDLHEMLLNVLCGGAGCHDMSLFGRSKERFLRRFMVLAHGIPSHDAFSDLFNALDPKGFQPVMQRLPGDFAANLEGVVAIDGKALRRSFDKTSGKSPLSAMQGHHLSGSGCIWCRPSRPQRAKRPANRPATAAISCSALP